MKLDCDPTTIYAAMLTAGGAGTIYRSDPGQRASLQHVPESGSASRADCQSGMESLKAALQPAQTDWLYFVAKPDGSGAHNFSNDLASHNLNVQQYRNAAPR